MGLVNDFMNPQKDESQLRELMFEITKEAMGPYDFENDDWCVFADCTNLEDDIQSFELPYKQRRK